MTITNVASEVFGSVWKVEMNVGDAVKAGDTLMILESMKMEIPVEAPVDGKIAEFKVQPEDSVDEEQILCTIES